MDGVMDPLENAERELPKLAREFLHGWRSAAKPGANWAQMHVSGWRPSIPCTRWSCSGRFMAKPGQRIERLREVQQVLGEINDCHTSRDWW